MANIQDSWHAPTKHHKVFNVNMSDILDSSNYYQMALSNVYILNGQRIKSTWKRLNFAIKLLNNI